MSAFKQWEQAGAKVLEDNRIVAERRAKFEREKAEAERVNMRAITADLAEAIGIESGFWNETGDYPALEVSEEIDGLGGDADAAVTVTVSIRPQGKNTVWLAGGIVITADLGYNGKPYSKSWSIMCEYSFTELHDASNMGRMAIKCYNPEPNVNAPRLDTTGLDVWGPDVQAGVGVRVIAARDWLAKKVAELQAEAEKYAARAEAARAEPEPESDDEQGYPDAEPMRELSPDIQISDALRLYIDYRIKAAISRLEIDDLL